MGRIADLGIRVRAEVQGALSAFDQVQNKLKELKRATGEESALGQIGKIALGAGAVAGIGAIARVMENASKAAADLSQQLANGAISAEDIGTEVLKLIPIIGSAVRAAENIGNALGPHVNANVSKALDDLPSLQAAIRMRKELAQAETAEAEAAVRRKHEFDAIRDKLDKLDILSGGATKGQMDAARRMLDEIAALEDLKKARQDAADAAKKSADELEKRLDDIFGHDATATLRADAKAAKEIFDNLADAGVEASIRLREEQQKTVEELRRLGESPEQAAQRRFQEETAALRDALAGGVIDDVTAQDLARQALKRLRDATSQTISADDSIDRTARIAQAAGERLSLGGGFDDEQIKHTTLLREIASNTRLPRGLGN